MLRGLWQLTWLEIKIFVREPLGVIGSVAIPVVIFVVMGRAMARPPHGDIALPRPPLGDVPILASMLIAVSAVQSLIAIVAIYREGGILKRLRATPLRPHTILTAHVLVKLLFTAITLALMVLAGRRVYTIPPAAPVSFALALLFSTTCLVSM